LPWQHEPAPPKLVGTEEHDLYTLERLVPDLNGIALEQGRREVLLLQPKSASVMTP
jgi:hypothetical protein